MLTKNNKRIETNQQALNENSSFRSDSSKSQSSPSKSLGSLVSRYISKNRLKVKYSVDKEPSETIKENIYDGIKELTSAEKETLYEIYYYILRYKAPYVSQHKIAKRLNLSREHVNRCIKVITDMGFVAKEFRGIKKTCIYRFTSFFNTKENARKLIQLLSPKRIFSILLLSTLNVVYNHDPMDIVTQYQKRDMINLFTQLYSPSETIKIIQKQYNLSQTGVIKLMVFPDQAIKDIFQQLEQFKIKPKDPCAYIISQLKQYCSRNDIKPNWAIFYKLMEINNLPYSSPNYLDNKSVSDKKNNTVGDISDVDRSKNNFNSKNTINSNNQNLNTNKPVMTDWNEEAKKLNKEAMKKDLLKVGFSNDEADKMIENIHQGLLKRANVTSNT